MTVDVWMQHPTAHFLAHDMLSQGVEVLERLLGRDQRVFGR